MNARIHGSIEVVERERLGLPLPVLIEKREQQAEGITIGLDGLRADRLLLREMVGEERTEQRAERDMKGHGATDRGRPHKIDNPRPLVVDHDAETREVEFNDRFLAFAAYWGFRPGFRPRACAPYRARTKGKDERGVGYVKGNAIAGHRFESWAGMEAHLGWWQREIADWRRHGTTGEVPFGQLRDLTRTVHADCAVWWSTPTPTRCRGG